MQDDYLRERLDNLDEKVTELRSEVKAEYTLLEKFLPVQRITYWLVAALGTILITTVSAIVVKAVIG